MSLRFEPIQPEHFSLAYKFLRDSLSLSFGEKPEFWPNKLGEMTEQKYRDVLQRKILRNPASAIHVFEGDRIIGQIEWSIKEGMVSCGYVSLYYLVPSRRGHGLGNELDSYVCKKLVGLGCKKVQLTVEPSNLRAIAFYKKVGWLEKGKHPIYSGLLMEKKLNE